MTALESVTPHRIPSFIRRQGRLTLGQKSALANYWERYCLNPGQNYDFAKVFDREAQVIVEIGFGNGESLVQMAHANPDKNYIGVEVHRPGTFPRA